ncbi:MAG: group 1 glycosyl transferase, partial [Methylobacterium sp.]|nr:group 1 glycosyl transferase [Methylobacterium sp.]
MTRVLLATTSFPENAHDWRGRFIADMMQALAQRADIELRYWGPPGQLPAGVNAAMPAQDAAWLRELLQRGGIAHLLRQRGLFALPVVLELLRRLRRAYLASDAQLFHINWLQNALPMGRSRQPALITVLGSDLGLLRLPSMVRLLRFVLRGRRVLLAPNADWMAPLLAEAFGDITEIRTIPFGIADAWFAVQRDYAAENRDWLAVTRLTPGKLGDLFAWGAGVFGPQRRLHLFGPRQDASITIPDWVHYHG